MADQADVETALAAIAANALYPAGTAAPSAIGKICRIYRGVPNAPALNKDLADGVLHVSVTASGAAVRNTTRFPRRWITVQPVTARLTVACSGETAVFSGTCAAGQLAGVIVDDALFPYAVQNNDSPATVASNLAAMIRAAGDIVAYSNATISCPGAARFAARVVNGAVALQEIKRQVQEFEISLWCPDPASRDAASPVIDLALAAQNFVALADGSFGHLVFARSAAEDNEEDAMLYRRDLTYSVEYPTTCSQITPAMLFGTTTVTANTVTIGEVLS